MKIKIELETTESETFSALDKLEYFADRIREAAALFQGKIIDEMAADFPWPPPASDTWPEEAEEEEEDAHFDEGHPWPPEDFEDDRPTAPPIQFKTPVDATRIAQENTAPIWSTLSLSAASSAYEEEEKAEAMPGYLKPEIGNSSVTADTFANLPTLSHEIRHRATEAFDELVRIWVQNFPYPGLDQSGPQPDRLDALRKIGSGPYSLPVLIMSFEERSLQRLVEKSLIRLGIGSALDRLDLADTIAGNMVQISHLVFPDLTGAYDYSTKWRRE